MIDAVMYWDLDSWYCPGVQVCMVLYPFLL